MMMFVQAARSYGYALVSRSPGQAVVTTPSGRLLIYHTLHVLEFDSERKCMSVIVKEDWSGRILLYSKGADSVIFSNLANPDTGVLTTEMGEGRRRSEEREGEEGGEERVENRRELTEQHLTLYAKQGLRTLCMARKVRVTALHNLSMMFQATNIADFIYQTPHCVYCTHALIGPQSSQSLSQY